MELSILQHARDKAPRQVTLDEVVGQIRGDQWPAGYEPLIVVGAVVNGGLQKKNIRWLNGLCVAHIRGGDPQVCDDPHTKLSWNDQNGGIYVVYEYELNDSFGKEQQARYYSRVQHFGMEYYSHLTGGEPDHTLVGVTKPVPLCHDSAVYYNAEAMAFHSADISGKPPEKQAGGNSKTAKPKEIKDWLNARVKLRRNVVTGREEYSEYLGVDTNDIWFDVWKPVDDIWLNTQWMEMADEQVHGLRRERVLHEARLLVGGLLVDADLVDEEGPERAMGAPDQPGIGASLVGEGHLAVVLLVDHALVFEHRERLVDARLGHLEVVCDIDRAHRAVGDIERKHVDRLEVVLPRPGEGVVIALLWSHHGSFRPLGQLVRPVIRRQL